MRDDPIYDNNNVSFDINTIKIKEFTNNISSGESYDYSISFEPQSRIMLGIDNFEEHFYKNRPLRKKFPYNLK